MCSSREAPKLYIPKTVPENFVDDGFWISELLVYFQFQKELFITDSVILQKLSFTQISDAELNSKVQIPINEYPFRGEVIKELLKNKGIQVQRWS